MSTQSPWRTRMSVATRVCWTRMTVQLLKEYVSFFAMLTEIQTLNLLLLAKREVPWLQVEQLSADINDTTAANTHVISGGDNLSNEYPRFAFDQAQLVDRCRYPNKRVSRTHRSESHPTCRQRRGRRRHRASRHSLAFPSVQRRHKSRYDSRQSTPMTSAGIGCSRSQPPA